MGYKPIRWSPYHGYFQLSCCKLSDILSRQWGNANTP